MDAQNNALTTMHRNIEQWKSFGIKEKEIDSAMDTLGKMQRALEEKNFSIENIDKLYAQWMFVASRMNKGIPYVDDPHYSERDKATYQYQFLLTLLGVYDYFFKNALDELPHKLLQSSILNMVDY